MSKNIVIAGGSGLIGNQLTKVLRDQGHTVSILSRSPKGNDQFYWDPKKSEIDLSILTEVEVLINLSGAGISDKRWTDNYKKILFDSRIGTNTFLYSHVDSMLKLEQFISSSGINCYGYDDPQKVCTEKDPYGKDFISQLVKDWEESADLFKDKCKVVKIRTAVVLDPNGGALKKILPPIKMGIGSPLGSGEQMMCWIHSEDLARIFAYTIERAIEGTFNAVSDYVTNKDFNKAIADQLDKPFWFPSVPAFLLKILFGEMAILILNGNKVSNEKIKSTGFVFDYPTLDKALKDVL